MLDFLVKSKNKEFDTIVFLSGDKEDTVQVQFNVYKDKGKNIGGSALGDTYHIILFKEDKNGNLINSDRFEAILICPLEYISSLIIQKWYGIIARKTTTSDSFVDQIFTKLME